MINSYQHDPRCASPLARQHPAFAHQGLRAHFDEDITKAIPNGAEVEIDPEQGVVAVLG